MNNKEYSIGLTVGSKAVGWSVIDNHYKVISKKLPVFGNTNKKSIKKNFIGSRLFEMAQTAEKKRSYRASKRLVRRRQNRISYLQEIFEKEMSLVDKNFFARLKESFLTEDDKKLSTYTLFGDEQLEKEFYHDFPTTYHLRSFLANTTEKQDLRLVYLAIAHAVKNRGHFLISGELDTAVVDIDTVFHQLLQLYSDYVGGDINIPEEKLSQISSKNMSPSKKVGEVLSHFPGEKKNGLLGSLLSLAFGLSVNMKKPLELEEDFKIQLSDDDYDALLEELLSKVSDADVVLDLFEETKNLYNAILLSSILSSKTNDSSPLSTSMVKKYENHARDLKLLKKIIKEDYSEEYDSIFRDDNGKGYAAYILNNTTKEEFYNYLTKLLSDNTKATEILSKMESGKFLDKLRVKDNAVIPHQLHLQEVQSIIDNQAKHYPFLLESKSKIESLISFRLPYYTGPLEKNNSKNGYSWIKRRSDDPIRPWSFNEVVDVETSAERFIDKLTKRCTYFPKEKVLPKNSLTYQLFTIYNELVTLKLVDKDGEIKPLSMYMKQDIVDDLFKKYKTVSKSRLMNYLNDKYEEYNIINVLGIDERTKKLNSSYSTYLDLKKILGEEFVDDVSNLFVLEDIVLTLTLFEDRKIVESKLSKYKKIIPDKALNQLKFKRYRGWGNLSRKLIDDIRDPKTQLTLLGHLSSQDNRNLMQLIKADTLIFKEKIEEAQSEFLKNKLTFEELVADVAGSPSIKKGLLQSLKVVDELVRVMGKLPKEIAINMPRENQSTSKVLSNNKKRLEKIKDGLKALDSDLLEREPVTNEELQNNKIYLYYLQNGIDVYTGLPIDRDKLSMYDKKHIISKNFLKDDSIDNLVLTQREGRETRISDNGLPNKATISLMNPYWNALFNANLISQVKLSYLTKIVLTKEDKVRFVRRQLVEQRQITKHLARILDEYYNRRFENGKRVRDVKIVLIKERMIDDFRKELHLPKFNLSNDYHYAHDAYLTTVIVKALLLKYPKLSSEFVFGEYNKFDIRKMFADSNKEPFKDKATAKLILYSNLLKFLKSDKISLDENDNVIWDRDKHVSVIQKTLNTMQLTVSKKVETGKGKFSKETIYPKGNSKKLMPIKNGLSTESYGGYISPVEAYSVLVKGFKKKGKDLKLTPVSELVSISVMEKNLYEKDPEQFLLSKGYHNIDKASLMVLPKYSLLEFDNSTRRLLASSNEMQKGNHFVINQKYSRLLYACLQSLDNDPEGIYKKELEENRTVFFELFDDVIRFSRAFLEAESNTKKLISLFDKNKDADVKTLAKSFVELMKFVSFGVSIDFNFFGEKIARKRYTSLSNLSSAILINQSITGLLETRRKLI